MHTKTVYQGAKGLTRLGCAVLRFNFRGVGASAGSFDQGEGEKADFTAALDYMAARYPGRPLWAAGFRSDRGSRSRSVRSTTASRR